MNFTMYKVKGLVTHIGTKAVALRRRQTEIRTAAQAASVEKACATPGRQPPRELLPWVSFLEEARLIPGLGSLGS